MVLVRSNLPGAVVGPHHPRPVLSEFPEQERLYIVFQPWAREVPLQSVVVPALQVLHSPTAHPNVEHTD